MKKSSYCYFFHLYVANFFSKFLFAILLSLEHFLSFSTYFSYKSCRLPDSVYFTHALFFALLLLITDLFTHLHLLFLFFLYGTYLSRNFAISSFKEFQSISTSTPLIIPSQFIIFESSLICS